MKFKLKEFQEKSVQELLKRIALARQGIRAGINQAIVLSSPTGSGKTITLAALLECIVRGTEEYEANSQATFLWVSDSPELNVQSLDKIFRASDAFPLHRLIMVDASFDQERFSPGYVYFINTSKLGKEKLLTVQGDKRTHTFWQTVANTSKESPGDLFVIIDEAHRGMGMSIQERNRAQTIVQKFILGSEDDKMPPVPIILGISATPQRFDELLGTTDRSKNALKITPEDVRDSGLLKELILVQMPGKDTPGDLTLLEQATRRWVDFGKQWEEYSKSQKLEEAVKPVLVIQVEDGSESVLTRTNLPEAIRVIERSAGPLDDVNIAHCFQEDNIVEAGGRQIRKVEASRIQDDANVLIIFFKKSLTTGWDCPRAEVMMSFRKAKDHTLIAQLVGRMIRTPLSRRIEGNEVLNTVELFLPHYDNVALDQTLNELRNPDAETGLGTRAEAGRDMATYPCAAAMGDVLNFVESLPSYSVGRVSELHPVKRLMRLASRLTLEDEIDPLALDEARDTCVNVLIEAKKRLIKKDPKFADRVSEAGELEIVTFAVRVGNLSSSKYGTTKVPLTPENVEDVFDQCGRVIGSGEGIHKEFWKRLYNPTDPLRPKLELYEVLREPTTMQQLTSVATEKFRELYKRNKTKIAVSPSSQQEPYNRLLGAGKAPEVVFRKMPSEILVRKGKNIWRQHLYADSDGGFSIDLNSWEKAVIDEEMKRKDFICWLRNIDRKEWAIAVPYDDRGIKPFYPDFVIIRREGKSFVADLIDPHNSKLDDTWSKAKGLAEYADKHGNQFGRLEIIIVEGGILKRMDVNDPLIRKKAKKFQSNNDVDALFV